MNIQIVNETGCFMYLDEQGNYIDSFFIGQYWFDIISKHQKETLKEILQKDNIKPFEIFYKHEKLYLTFINKNNDQHSVYEIYNDGTAKCFLQSDFVKTLEFIDYSSFNLLHDFNEKN